MSNIIPKIIHYCWLGDAPYPDLVTKCIASWHKHLKDYEFVLWDKKKFDINSVEWVKEAYNCKKYAFAADYIRLYALYTEGGIYLDTDVEVLKDFSPLLEQSSFMGYEASNSMEPAIIGAQSGLEWIKICLDYYKNRHFIKQNKSLDVRPLPHIIGETIRNNYQYQKDTSKIIFINKAQLALYPKDYFGPKSYKTNKINISDNTYAIHHFAASWLSTRDKIVGFIIKLFGKRLSKFLLKIYHRLFD
ncbi:MAG: glycosyl transferase [Bacteroidales bacterium]|jgi:hypothetical protein|nr:glycosyl transferase [Bacteroidales bacterium]